MNNDGYCIVNSINMVTVSGHTFAQESAGCMKVSFLNGPFLLFSSLFNRPYFDRIVNQYIMI